MCVSHKYNVNMSNLYVLEKKSSKRKTASVKVCFACGDIYIYIFQFSSHFHLFFLPRHLGTQYPVCSPCLLSVTSFVCLTDFKHLSRLKVGLSESDDLWEVWGLPCLIL